MKDHVNDGRHTAADMDHVGIVCEHNMSPEPKDAELDHLEDHFGYDHLVAQRFLRTHALRLHRRRRLKRFGWMIVSAFLLYGFVFSQGGLTSILLSKLRVQGLQSRVAILQAEQATLENQIQQRQHHPPTLERIAREDYGMILPGDKIFRIQEVDENQALRIEKRQREKRAAARAIEEAGAGFGAVHK